MSTASVADSFLRFSLWKDEIQIAFFVPRGGWQEVGYNWNILAGNSTRESIIHAADCYVRTGAVQSEFIRGIHHISLQKNRTHWKNKCSVLQRIIWCEKWVPKWHSLCQTTRKHGTPALPFLPPSQSRLFHNRINNMKNELHCNGRDLLTLAIPIRKKKW